MYIVFQVLNTLRHGDAYMLQLNRPYMVQVITCRLVGAKPLPESISIDSLWTNFGERWTKAHHFTFNIIDLKMPSTNFPPFGQGLHKQAMPSGGRESVNSCAAACSRHHSHNPWSTNSDNKVPGANMGPTCVLSAPDGPQVGPGTLLSRKSSELLVLW